MNYVIILSYKPNIGDFLTKNTTPRIAYIVKEDVEGIISSSILNLKIDELIKNICLCV